jgi:DNA repair protein RecO (recombination protein O)
MEEEKSEGIVLRSIDYKERERIITVFTSNAGLISLIVKNISRRNSHFLALSTPFCHAEFLYRKGRSELFRFQDGTVLDEMLSLRNHLGHLQAAGELVNAILYSQMPGKPASLLYALLSVYMKQIPHFENTDVLTASFYLKVLKHEGLLTLSEESLSHGELSIHLPGGAFSPEESRRLEELLSVRHFERLKELKISPELCAKIRTCFKNF